MRTVKVTTPVGLPPAGGTALTAAVKTTLLCSGAGLGAAVTVIAAPARSTVCVIIDEELLAKPSPPLYCATIGWSPTVRSVRVNVATGAWVCMSCGEKGGDVLAYEIKDGGREFVDAAKALGCWVDDGRRPPVATKPTPLSPRLALSVIAFESTLAAVAAGNVANGVTLTDADRARLMVAANRINRLVEAFA